MKRLAILASTGSIGVNTLDIVRKFPERLEVVSLSAGTNIQLLKKQILEFHPRMVAVFIQGLAETLRKELSTPSVEIVDGVEGLIRVATHPEVDQVVSAIVGAAGLIPTLKAITCGKQVALANKETLVMAGKIIMGEARRRKVRILPVDSEHGALFQLLRRQMAGRARALIFSHGLRII